MGEQGLLINGEEVYTANHIEVTNKFTGKVILKIHEAGEKEVDLAVNAARSAFKNKKLTPYQRYEILLKAAELTKNRAEDIARIMAEESGITIKDAKGEITRAIQTLIISGEEAKRITGEVLPVKANPGMENRTAYTVRVPVGVICAITPFNAPFNNVVHKVAPAIAAGNTVVLKPSSLTPRSAMEVLSILQEAGLPKEHIQIVFGEVNTGQYLLKHQGINFYTFTGSTRVGEIIKTNSGLRRVALELGNNSATIVCQDANLEAAVPIITKAAFRKAGQVCVSLQRIYAHSSVSDKLAELLTEEMAKLKIGDPLDPDTDVGPVISDQKAEQLEEWVKSAISDGAVLKIGGYRDGNLFRPTLLINAKQHMKVVCEEVFGPILSIVSYDDFDEVIELVNDTPYGLQAGIFTNELNRIMKAVEHLEFGGININETSNTRFDAMPYGGLKSSGIGREGPKYAIEEMTEMKIVQLNTLG